MDTTGNHCADYAELFGADLMSARRGVVQDRLPSLTWKGGGVSFSEAALLEEMLWSGGARDLRNIFSEDTEPFSLQEPATEPTPIARFCCHIQLSPHLQSRWLRLIKSPTTASTSDKKTLPLL